MADICGYAAGEYLGPCCTLPQGIHLCCRANQFNDETIVQLLFNCTTGYSDLNWDLQTPGDCEYSDISGLVIFSKWNNGSATIWQPPAITGQPVNTNTYSDGNTDFTVTATGLNLIYQWQKSTDGGTSWSNLTNIAPYSGMFSPTLSISPASTTLNGCLYRCNIAGTCTPFVFSGTAQLTVTPFAITTAPSSISNSCAGNLYVPLNVTNCNNIRSISLTLLYDTTKLTYDGYQGINGALAPGMLAVNQSDPDDPTGNAQWFGFRRCSPVYLALVSIHLADKPGDTQPAGITPSQAVMPIATMPLKP